MRRALALALALAACASSPEPTPTSTATPPDTGTPPPAGTVGAHGGTVDRMFFAFHGDTRPGHCDATASYPSGVIGAIFAAEAARGVQFAVDLGDHMFVCNQSVDEARAQMGLYTAAAATLGKPVFMTMGNHECGSAYCPPVTNDANFVAFKEALAPTANLPWYSVDVQTRSGLATFVFIADNAWDDAQAAWLDATLARTDATAKYTIVVRHHPVDNTQYSNAWIASVVQKHKYTLFLTGHTHAYRRDVAADASGRSLRMGCGGAPLAGGGFYGYGIVTQGSDDKLAVEIVDQASGAVRDAFSVDPQ